MLTQQDAAALEADLAQFCGTDNWWKHWTGRITYTDGVKFLAEKAGAFWLIDLVASHQTARLRQEEFQIWTLTVDRRQNADGGRHLPSRHGRAGAWSGRRSTTPTFRCRRSSSGWSTAC